MQRPTLLISSKVLLYSLSEKAEEIIKNEQKDEDCPQHDQCYNGFLLSRNKVGNLIFQCPLVIIFNSGY
jgi:hypothetical protein